MVLSAIDWHQRVNGYSGFFPNRYGDVAFQLNSFANGPPASPDAVALLRSLRVRYIVMRTAPLTRQVPSLEVPGYGYAGTAKAGKGEVVALGESLWWSWVSEKRAKDTDNGKFLAYLLAPPKKG